MSAIGGAVETIQELLAGGADPNAGDVSPLWAAGAAKSAGAQKLIRERGGRDWFHLPGFYRDPASDG